MRRHITNRAPAERDLCSIATSPPTKLRRSDTKESLPSKKSPSKGKNVLFLDGDYEENVISIKMNKIIFLSLVSIIIGACNQSKLNLDLDNSIIDLINIYTVEYQSEHGKGSLDSIDLFVYEHPFNKYVMIVKSSPTLPDIPFFITYFDKVKIRVFSGTRLLFKDKSQFYIEENLSKYGMKSIEEKNEAVIFDPPFHFYLADNGQFIRCDIWSCLHENLPPIPRPTIKYEPPD